MREIILNNLIFILIAIFLVANFLSGFEKGFIRKVISIATIIVTIVVTKHFTPSIVETVKNMTNIEATINTRIYEAFIETNVFDTLNLGALEKFLGTDAMQSMIRDKIATSLTGIILNLVCGIALFIFTFLVIKIIIKLLDFIDYIPVVGEINKILGGIFGVIEALIIIWLVFAVVKVFENIPAVNTAIKQINNNFLVKALYDNNVIFDFFSNLFKIQGKA